MTQTSSPPGRSETASRPGREWLGMAVVGAVSVALDFGIFNLLLLAGAGAAIANLAAIGIATLVAFWGNLRWSFGHRSVADPGRAVAAFFAVNLVSAAAVELGVVAAAAVSSEYVVLNSVKLALTVVATVVRFIAYRSWVYRDSTVTIPKPEPDTATQ